MSTSANNSSSTPATTNEPRRFPHDAPERDFVNYPPLRIPEHGGKLRIGLVPDEWFKAMYDKTGVTGPYILFWGGIATLISKEYFVYWADTAEQFVFLGALIAGSKLYGKKIGEMLDSMADAGNKEALAELESQSKAIDEKIAKNNSLQSLPEANKLINLAKRVTTLLFFRPVVYILSITFFLFSKENVHLQIEALYRSRIAQVYQEVKKRLVRTFLFSYLEISFVK